MKKTICSVLAAGALFLAAGAAHAGTVSYTGAELDALVTAGQASYPSTTPVSLTGTRLDFGSGPASPLLFILPLVGPGQITDFDVTIDVFWRKLTSDNDFGWGLTDGTRIVGGMQGDQPTWWTLDSVNSGSTYTGENFQPSGSMTNTGLLGQSLRLVGNASGTTTTVTNNSGQSLSFNLSGLNAAAGLSLFLAGDHGGERYGVHSLTVTSDFVPVVPLPPTAWMGLGLLGGLGLMRRLQKRRSA